jgi:uncharacterized protein DUF6062
MARHTHHFEVVDALERPGCALCRLATRSVLEYFASLGHEQVNDVVLRDELRAASGFCPRHAWLFHESSGNRLGVAIVYRDLLQHTLQTGVDRGRSFARGSLGQRLRRLFGGKGAPAAPAAACTACRFERDAEERYGGAFVEHLDDSELRERYARSPGFCLSHLAGALASAGRAADHDWLRQDAEQRLRGLIGELDEYIRKHDYRFRAEQFGEEKDAPERAVARLAGSGNIVPEPPLLRRAGSARLSRRDRR